jgi:glycopeptide antibiotics resistance protein
MGLLQGGGLALNVVLFVPSGVLVGLAVLMGRRASVLVPVGIVGLAVYSCLIEVVQRLLPEIDRRCDLTDVYQNVAGAVCGAAFGVVVAVIALRGRAESRQ